MVKKICGTTDREFITCGGSTFVVAEPTEPPITPPPGSSDGAFIVIQDQPFYTSAGEQFIVQPGA